MAQGIQPTQGVLNQLLANQAGNQGANLENIQGEQLPANPRNPQVVLTVSVFNPPIATEVP